MNGREVEKNGNLWRSNFWRRIPYSAGFGLLTVLCCAVADGIILWKSDGQEVGKWIISPSVLLAIISASANMSLQHARNQGAVTAWWRKSLRGGRLRDLSVYWSSNDSIFAALTAGQDFNLVALATLVASLVVLDGPLLQRASTVATKSVTVDVIVTAPIAQQLPYGYTAFGSISGPSPQFVMNQTFAEVVNNYNIRAPITTSFHGCHGNCSGVIKAAGLAMNCSLDSIPWDNSIGTDNFLNNITLPNVFNSNFTWLAANLTNGSNPWPGYPLIDFELAYAVGRTPPATLGSVLQGGEDNSPLHGICKGTVMRKHCSLLSATLEYPISMSNNTVSLLGNSSNFKVVGIQPVGPSWTYASSGQPDENPMTFSTLGGVAMAAQNMFRSTAVQDYYGDIALEGNPANQYASYGEGNASFTQTQDACSMNWRDPTDDMVNALNEIMFRTALTASNVSTYSIMNVSINQFQTSFYEAIPIQVPRKETGKPSPQMVTMKQTSAVTVFESHYEFLGAALSIMILGILVVIPTLHGFWELGRQPSLNPLEIAKAFNAEMLRGDGSNTTAAHLTRALGDRRVQYGEVVDDGLVGAPEVSMPRLELADPSRVIEPRNKVMYT